MPDLYKGKPVEAVELDMTLGQKRALSCKYGGALYHIWIEPKHLGDPALIKDGGWLYKNPPLPGPVIPACSHRQLDPHAKFGSGLIDVMVAVALRDDALGKAMAVEEAKRAAGEAERTRLAAIAMTKEAGPKMLSVMKKIAGLPGAMVDIARAGIADEFTAAIAAAEGRSV